MLKWTPEKSLWYYQFTSSLNPPSTIGITHTLHLMNKETATPIHTYGWARSQFRKYSITSDSLRKWPQFAFQLFKCLKHISFKSYIETNYLSETTTYHNYNRLSIRVSTLSTHFLRANIKKHTQKPKEDDTEF